MLGKSQFHPLSRILGGFCIKNEAGVPEGTPLFPKFHEILHSSTCTEKIHLVSKLIYKGEA